MAMEVNATANGGEGGGEAGAGAGKRKGQFRQKVCTGRGLGCSRIGLPFNVRVEACCDVGRVPLMRAMLRTDCASGGMGWIA